MATWIFWLMLVVIVVLFAVLVIRDSKLRDALKRFFSGIKKKIRVARLRSKIKNENEKIRDLLKKLGEETWRKHVTADFISEEKSSADNLDTEKQGVDAAIEKLNGEIEKNKQAFDEFSKKQDASLKEQDEKRTPLANDLSRLKKELQTREKEVNEREKTIAKLEKKTAAGREKIAEIEKNANLPDEEKKKRKDEIENDIKEATANRDTAQQEMESLGKEKPALEKRIAEIEPVVKELDGKINALKEEKKAEEKKMDEIVAGLKKNRNDSIARQNQLKKELDALFEKIGEKIAKNRVQNSDLAPLYTQIDSLKQTIQDLEKQVELEKVDKNEGE
ncbi:MAG: hypothetical protein L0Y73_03155 [Candidatus Aminicenantes bacterium]|nr:hypothetical protein [Candidatus Aminicenantes bacterium]